MNYSGIVFRGKRLKAVLSTVLLVCFLFAVAGCGDGSSWSTDVSGVVAKGLIKQGTVKVFIIDDNGAKGRLLATTQTDDNGKYSVVVPSKGSVLVEVTGGSYMDEATGKLVDREGSKPLRAVVAEREAGGAINIAVTDLTETAVRIAEKKDGKFSKENIEKSNKDVSRILGVDGATGEPLMDITQVNPVDINDPNAFKKGNKSQKTYAKMLAVISQAAANDDEKDSEAILEDLSDFMGGNAPAGSVSMATTLAKAASDFFNGENNVTGETDFSDIQTAVNQAKYTASERVTGISVYSNNDRISSEEKGAELESKAQAKVSFAYDKLNNLSEVKAQASDFMMFRGENHLNIGFSYTKDGNVDSIDALMGDGNDGKIDEGKARQFQLDNVYDATGKLVETILNVEKEAKLQKYLTVAFRSGNLYDIASCLLAVGEKESVQESEQSEFSVQTTVDAAGLLASAEVVIDKDEKYIGEIRRLKNGRLDRILVKELSTRRDDVSGSSEPKVEAIVVGNWFQYDSDGNLDLVVAVYPRRGVLKNPDGVAAALIKAKNLNPAEFEQAMKKLSCGVAQYTTYNYLSHKTGEIVEQIDIKHVDWDYGYVDGKEFVEDVYTDALHILFKNFTPLGNAQRIELLTDQVDRPTDMDSGKSEMRAPFDPLLGYAELTYENKPMKRNVWTDAVKELVRTAYRNSVKIGFMR